MKKNQEKLTDIEILRVENALLATELMQTKLERAGRNKNEIVREIIAAHGFDPSSKVLFPQGIIEGEKLSGPVGIVKDDKTSDGK